MECVGCGGKHQVEVNESAKKGRPSDELLGQVNEGQQLKHVEPLAFRVPHKGTWMFHDRHSQRAQGPC